ncbi:MAG: triosephosphate isomerase [Chloroflexi bacterium]|nr:MAG: triosephosphate isomerase [Chloroflexota bacterium]
MPRSSAGRPRSSRIAHGDSESARSRCGHVRKPLVVGNWKMNTTQQEATILTRSVVDSVSAYAASVEVVLLPPFPWLTDIARLLPGSAVALGAQNMHTESGGAYTGEVSPRMLKGLCRYVLVGQYERRILFSERDAIVRRKLHSAQQHGLRPVVGEQIEADLEGANLQESLVIAYDPAWTTMGLVAPPPLDYVGKVISHIRDTLSSLFSSSLAQETRLIYGGSVNLRNIAEIAALPDVDGVLAGTASLNADNFAALVRAFAQ